MKKVKSISDYMPAHKHEETELIQAKVLRSLKKEFIPLLKARNNTFLEFIEASMRKFIDENKGKRLT